MSARQLPGALLLATLGAAGCASTVGYPDRSGNITAELKALDPYFAPEVLTTYRGKANQPTEQQRYRDEVINSRIRAIDLHFTIFEQVLSQNIAGMNITSDWAVLGLSAAGALVGSATTKSILAALSGGITGAKGSVDKNLFYNKTLPALFAKMDALRRDALVTIRSGMQHETATYPLEQALLDIDEYYNAGTIPRALLGITTSAGEAGAAATQTLTALYQHDAATDLLRAYWKPDGKTIDTGHQTLLQDWMKEHDLKDISITLFLKGAQYSAQRQDAVKAVIK